jgi:hypothetical protein
MAMNEYRRHALECLWIADENTTSPENRTLLVGMAQAWLKLAQQAERDLTMGSTHDWGGRRAPLASRNR